MMMRTVLAALCALCAMLLAAPALAQDNGRVPGVRLSGTVQGLQGRTLVVKTTEGGERIHRPC